ncbi:hypothetical protein MPSEU_001029200 [Mayamaea pseudoterrestris]|nr:hypothetical protein MPSEU_001029200 [Mayamaea pseudoterrestris]
MPAPSDPTDPVSTQLSSFASSDDVARSDGVLRASNGAPVDTLTASMTAGKHNGSKNISGPIVLQDFTLLDHMAHFDHERIPERVVHAKGAGAFGYFEVTTDFGASVCKADFLQKVGTKTPVAVRFSTVGGESGSADTARDPRGFSIKFYTQEGNWDLVANNTPIFFMRDPFMFPSFIHTQKRNPATHLKDPNMFWDWISLRPESVHQVSVLFSDRGTPNGYRHMNGYGSHTFKNVNAQGEPCYVKYHFKTDQGISNLPADVAGKLAGDDPDYATRDLYNAIGKGEYPSWTMYLQVMTYEQAVEVEFHPFDVTKIWPHSEFPLHEVGRFVLNRNPKDYFTEVEQLAFSPSHMVPGVEPSPDKMLQARLFSYPDAHRHRLGPNYLQIPVNRPIVETALNDYHRDGFMQTVGGNGAPNYFPNSYQGPQPQESKAPTWHRDSISGQVERIDTGDEDNYSQCRAFFRMLSPEEQGRLTDNIAGHLSGAQSFIRKRAIEMFSLVDPEYGQAVESKIEAMSPPDDTLDVHVAELNPPRDIPPAEGPSNTRPCCPYGYIARL